MKKIKIKDKACLNCAGYCAYYEKLWHNFYNYGIGKCGESGKVVKDGDCCALFCAAERYGVTIKQVRETIKAVEQLLKLYL